MCNIYASANRKYGCPLWLWNPEEMSPEVQNMGISGPTQRTYVLHTYEIFTHLLCTS